MSRKKAEEAAGHGLEARADVITGDGLEAALQGVQVIVNCVTSPGKNTYETDVAGTRRLLARAKELYGDTIGRLTDFGGPEVLKLEDMASAWLDIQHIKRAIKPNLSFAALSDEACTLSSLPVQFDSALPCCLDLLV